jgi:predicted DNA-binding transcriptional regulator AlpA
MSAPADEEEGYCGVPNHPLLTVREVARLLRTTPKAIYARIGRGTVPGAIKSGATRYIRRDILLKSLREGRGSSNGGVRR